MRIISGYLGGRQFQSPESNRTHPMSDKVRGGLFSVLGKLDGLDVLDAFAGSGALSFEAISHGARSAVAVELDQKAAKIITSNLKTLGLDHEVKAVNANVSSWSNNNSESIFDIVFVAPPYDNLQLKVVTKLARHVKPGGLYVLDWPGSQEPPAIYSLSILKIKNYGDAQLVFYRKIL